MHPFKDLAGASNRHFSIGLRPAASDFRTEFVRKQKDDSWRLHGSCDAETATIRGRRTRRERMSELSSIPKREQTVSQNEQYKYC
jgi:hypothetical protein